MLMRTNRKVHAVQIWPTRPGFATNLQSMSQRYVRTYIIKSIIIVSFADTPQRKPCQCCVYVCVFKRRVTNVHRTVPDCRAVIGRCRAMHSGSAVRVPPPGGRLPRAGGRHPGSLPPVDTSWRAADEQND